MLAQKLIKHETTLRDFNHLFRQADKDRDGKVNFNEFFQLMNGLKIGLTEEHVVNLYKQLESSGESRVQYSHIISLLQSTEF